MGHRTTDREQRPSSLPDGGHRDGACRFVVPGRQFQILRVRGNGFLVSTDDPRERLEEEARHDATPHTERDLPALRVLADATDALADDRDRHADAWDQLAEARDADGD